MRVPKTEGVKVTFITQLCPAGRLLPHVLLWAKSPVTGTAAIFRQVVPVLESVTACGLLVVFRC